ncbi:TEA/ATTS domain family-domain-containing protein [Absidia repens]|uniref:TEA/ATTS domain family-domain-containing protein n=1 Tax=Absidia repens TaxID=90262 RepID=A0A1X2IWB8_9FUNG|nr:TEA/ATTS domain family-domain-containing protein [Absidia repens]
MLACTQDLFFNNDKPLARQDLLPTSLQQQPSPMPSTSFEQQQTKFAKKSSHMIPHHISEKDKEEQVWPPEVESAFIEALETIPKLGRRKILVNGKPCGRNELISDFIFRKTSKVRTRKQVSSHIQVLKNTRKNDPHFMRLLTDSVDLEDDFVHRKTPKNTTGKRPQPKHQPPFLNPNSNNNASTLPLGKFANLNSTASISSDESSIQSSPSPADYVFDMMYGDDHALSMLDIKDPFYDAMHPSFFDPNLGMPTPSNHPSISLAPSSTPSTTPHSFMHASSTGMATPALMDSACFNLSPMDTTTSAHMIPSVDMYNLQSSYTEEAQQLCRPQQQQQQQQIMHSYFPSDQQLHNEEVMMEPLRPLTQSRKLKRGNRRQKHSNSQYPRKRYPHYAVHRPSPFMNQHKNIHMPTAATVTHPTSDMTMPIMDSMAPNNTTLPMTTMPPPFSDVTLWPNYLCLYLEHTSPDAATLDPSMANSHTLAQLPHCFPNTVKPNDALSHGATLKERYNSLLQLNPSLSLIPSDVTLFAKMKLDLNFNMNDFYFNNTCFFESKDRRMIECTTTIYSFGNIVLESKEMQQALWTPDNKYMYSFAYVNQFFDAFMKGVKSLQSWEEVDIAIHNLCIVQVFEDMETKCQFLDNNNNNNNNNNNQQAAAAAAMMDTGLNYPCTSPHESSPSSISSSTTNTSTSPSSATLFENNKNNGGHLLALIYEFERGQGAIDMTTLHHHHQNNNDTIHDST